MGSGLGGHIAGKLGRRSVNVDIRDMDDAGIGITGQLGRQRPVEPKWRRHVYPIELIELGQLRRRICRLWFEGRGVVDHQRQILL